MCKTNDIENSKPLSVRFSKNNIWWLNLFFSEFPISNIIFLITEFHLGSFFRFCLLIINSFLFLAHVLNAVFNFCKSLKDS